MEEDIKKIEKDINYNKKQMEEIGSYIPFDIKLMERVENLIKGYRELEEKQQSYNTAYNQGKAFENHKWKSKVKEKLEEQYNLFNSKNQKEYSQEVVDVLEELLMEDK